MSSRSLFSNIIPATLLFPLLSFTFLARAQVSASIKRTISDPSGAAVPSTNTYIVQPALPRSPIRHDRSFTCGLSTPPRIWPLFFAKLSAQVKLSKP